jgi:hypothetical protein
MIIEFSVENFRSIKETQVLSFLADDVPPESCNNSCSQADVGDLTILKSAIICGPNASGKSNLLGALLSMRSMVLFSGKLSIDQVIPAYMPFLLDDAYKTRPTSFSLEFFAPDLYNKCITRRYILKISFGKKKIVNESLRVFLSARPSVVYERADGVLKRGAYLKGKSAVFSDSLLDNRLYLSVAGDMKDNPLNVIFRFFRDYVIHDREDSSFSIIDGLMGTPRQMRNDLAEGYLCSVSKLLYAVDTGIKDIKISKGKKPSIKFQGLPKDVEEKILSDLSMRPKAIHVKFSDGIENGIEEFDFKEESAGSIRFFKLACTMIDVLRRGGSLIIDELHQNLHPDLTRFIIQLFHNKSTNKKNAQIIFTSHDLFLLSPELFGRDQVWFTEKDRFGATKLFSLLEFGKDKVRRNTSYYQWYMDGKFGALPIVDNVLAESIFSSGEQDAAPKSIKRTSNK